MCCWPPALLPCSLLLFQLQSEHGRARGTRLCRAWISRHLQTAKQGCMHSISHPRQAFAAMHNVHTDWLSQCSALTPMCLYSFCRQSMGMGRAEKGGLVRNAEQQAQQANAAGTAASCRTSRWPQPAGPSLRSSRGQQRLAAGAPGLGTCSLTPWLLDSHKLSPMLCTACKARGATTAGPGGREAGAPNSQRCGTLRPRGA